MNKKIYLYFITHFTYGMIFSLFGPLIPYLAQSIGKMQSQFTYIFVLRGVSYVIAAFLQQSYLNTYNLHKRMLFSCFVSGICFFLFNLLYNRSPLSYFVCLIMFLAHGSMQVIINILIMSVKSQDIKKSISFSYGFYGVGCVMGSMIVGIIGIRSLQFCSVWLIVIGVIYINFLPTRHQNGQNLEEILLSSQQLQKKTSKKQFLNNQTQQIFCILFFLYAAISLSYRSWFPSFIVIEKIGTKQQAAISLSIYSAVLTIFRFVFTFWNPNIIKSLYIVSLVLVLTLFAAVANYVLGATQFLLNGSPIILGILFSTYIPYLYALPSEFDLSFTYKGTCNTIIAYAIGQAVVSAAIGCLMEWIHSIMLFVAIFLFSIFNYYFLNKCIQQLIVFKKEKENLEWIEMKEIK